MHGNLRKNIDITEHAGDSSSVMSGSVDKSNSSITPAEKTAGAKNCGHKLGAVLMAAGLGRRFGGDKLFARIGNTTLIEHALALLPAALFKKTAVVSKDERILALAKQYGFTPVLNDAPEEGISSSIRLGTNALEGLDAAMFFVCDQPNLSSETVRLLVGAFEETPDKIIVPEAKGKWGNPCIFPSSYFPELLALEGDTGGKAVIRKHPEAVRTIEVPEEELLDIDKKEDLPAR